MNGCYKNSYPDAVHSTEGFGVSPVQTKTEILPKRQDAKMLAKMT
jgi:hypothetical protein